jgi:hypothetical protein
VSSINDWLGNQIFGVNNAMRKGFSRPVVSDDPGNTWSFRHPGGETDGRLAGRIP